MACRLFGAKPLPELTDLKSTGTLGIYFSAILIRNAAILIQ